MVKGAHTKLMKAIVHNDVNLFESVLNHKQWPHDLNWSQYEFLIFHSFINRQRAMASLLLEKGCPVPVTESLIDVQFVGIINSIGSSPEMAETIMKCVKRGATVSYPNVSGETAIHHAFSNKASDKLMDLLLDQYIRETEDNLAEENGLSVLHIACTRRKLKVVRKIVDADEEQVNAQVNFSLDKDYAGYTPLHFAVKNKRYQVAEYLLEKDADVYAKDANGSTPLHLAFYSSDDTLIDMLLKFDPVTKNVKDEYGLSHFMVACTRSDTSKLRDYFTIFSSSKLVNSRVQNIHNLSYAGFTPLHFAAENGEASNVKLIVRRGADSKARSGLKLTAAQLARMQKHIKIYCFLKNCENETIID